MDVLGLSFPHFQIDISARLAQDTGSEGFSNDSNLQSTQPLLLRRSLDLAEQLVDVALPDAAELAPFDYTADLREYVAAVQARLEKKTGGHMAYRVDLPAHETARSRRRWRWRVNGPVDASGTRPIGSMPSAASCCSPTRCSSAPRWKAW